MNKEEIEAKLHNYEERLKDIAKAIEELRDQVAKVEKPKLRHGDFGVSWDDTFVVVEQGSLQGTPKAFFADQSGQAYADKNMPDAVVFGNIFDLMKGWGGDLGELEPGYGIIPQRSFKPIKIGGNWYEKEEAYDIWRWIGHALMKLKRKENSCS